MANLDKTGGATGTHCVMSRFGVPLFEDVMTGVFVIGRGKQDLVDTTYQITAGLFEADIACGRGPMVPPQRSRPINGDDASRGPSGLEDELCEIEAADEVGHPWIKHIQSLERGMLDNGAKQLTDGLHIQQQKSGIHIDSPAHD